MNVTIVHVVVIVCVLLIYTHFEKACKHFFNFEGQYDIFYHRTSWRLNLLLITILYSQGAKLVKRVDRQYLKKLYEIFLVLTYTTISFMTIWRELYPTLIEIVRDIADINLQFKFYKKNLARIVPVRVLTRPFSMKFIFSRA